VSLPPDLLERFVAYQADEKEFLARKAHFLESMDKTPDKLGDRVLERLREDEAALRERRDTIAREVKERLGMDL
jgi:hypothetical protein